MFPQDNTPQSLSIGSVELNVKDLELEKSFYIDLVGLREMNSDEDRIELGLEGKVLVVLHLLNDDSVRQDSIGQAGLYHLALRFSNQEGLADTVAKILKTHRHLYQGSADHLVSEAFYFADPEGNGVELYYDKPKSEWPYENGGPKMGGIYLDESEYIEKYGDKGSFIYRVDMGHVHLKVGDIAEAKRFYVELFKFDVIMEMPTALFISRDGYHHHLGLNTWESLGAGKREQNSLGLNRFTLEYKDKDLYNEIFSNLKLSNIQITEIVNGFEVKDPWGNIILLTRFLSQLS